MTWDEFMEADPVDCVPVAATDPLYILYTSGTTGIPKGVVRDNGGHLVALKWSMKHIYGVSPGDVFWAASDVGWVVGHSYIVYAPLAYGCTTILYEENQSAPPTRDHSGESSQIMGYRFCSLPRPHSGPSNARTLKDYTSENIIFPASGCFS
jgi:acyl-coenzyme A synthetase/AMP-(fatty) acid ligase